MQRVKQILGSIRTAVTPHCTACQKLPGRHSVSSGVLCTPCKDAVLAPSKFDDSDEIAHLHKIHVKAKAKKKYPKKKKVKSVE